MIHMNDACRSILNSNCCKFWTGKAVKTQFENSNQKFKNISLNFVQLQIT